MGDRLAELQKIAAVTPNTNEEKGEETSQDEPFVLLQRKSPNFKKILTYSKPFIIQIFHIELY